MILPSHQVEATESDIAENHPSNTLGNALLIELSNQVVGYITWHRSIASSGAAPAMLIGDIYISEEQKKLGFRKPIIVLLKNEAYLKRCQYVAWQILKTNASALAFHERLMPYDSCLYRPHAS